MVDVAALLFEKVWRDLDPVGGGFIYAKDMALFVMKCEDTIRDLAQDPEFKKLLKFPMLGTVYMGVLDTFAKESPYYKVYKSGFMDMFSKLVGARFDDTVKRVFEDTQGVPKEFVDKLGNKENTSLESPARVHLFQNAVKPPEVLETPRRLNKKYKSLELQLQSMKQEIEDKDKVIQDRERAVAQLNTSLQLYKEKYESLSREYELSLQKKNHRAPQIHVKHDTFIQELKTKLQEQNKMIRELRERIHMAPPTTIVKQRKTSNPFKKIVVAVVLIWILWFFTTIPSSTSQDVDMEGLAPLPWWERNNMISKLVWSFRDMLTADQPQSVQSDAYNKVFGIH